MKKIYKKDKDGVYNSVLPEGMHWLDAFSMPVDTPLSRIACIFTEGRVSYTLKSLKTLGRANRELYAIDGWHNDKLIIGNSLTTMLKCRESENEKILVPKESLINLLELWVKLVQADAPEIILSREGNIITLSGNGLSASLEFEEFRYEWEDYEEEYFKD